VSHCLSAPADPAWREGKVSSIEGALKGERRPDADLRRVAEAIFEFERNIIHQREIFVTCHVGDDEDAGESVVLENEAPLNHEIDEMLMIDERHGGPEEEERAWLIEAQTFIRRQQRINHARAKRDAVEEILRAERYMRRAANQLVKALRILLKGLQRLLQFTPFPDGLFNFHCCPKLWTSAMRGHNKREVRCENLFYGEAYFTHQQLAIHSALTSFFFSPAAHRVCNQNINNADHAANHNRQRQHQRGLALMLKMCRLEG
jgi:hypothetical protein